MNDPQASSPRSPREHTALVVTICTLRKKVRPAFRSTPASLPTGSQDVVQTAWIERLQTLPRNTVAGMLYSGRGFGLATQAARISSAKLYILSAGLGLVAADRQVPTYGLTVSSGHSESVAARVAGDFDPSAWFMGLQSSTLSDRWADAIGQLQSGRILIALTRPYARMVGESLRVLGPDIWARLRIFGISLATALPPALHPSIAPYDLRLDSILPGTSADFSQRALHHFAKLVVDQNEHDRKTDFAAVEAALGTVAAPVRPYRPRRTDDEILELIRTRLQAQSGAARILRALRDEEGVACEQSRFSRIYRAALRGREAA